MSGVLHDLEQLWLPIVVTVGAFVVPVLLALMCARGLRDNGRDIDPILCPAAVAELEQIAAAVRPSPVDDLPSFDDWPVVADAREARLPRLDRGRADVR